MQEHGLLPSDGQHHKANLSTMRVEHHAGRRVHRLSGRHAEVPKVSSCTVVNPQPDAARAVWEAQIANR